MRQAFILIASIAMGTSAVQAETNSVGANKSTNKSQEPVRATGRASATIVEPISIKWDAERQKVITQAQARHQVNKKPSGEILIVFE